MTDGQPSPHLANPSANSLPDRRPANPAKQLELPCSSPDFSRTKDHGPIHRRTVSWRHPFAANPATAPARRVGVLILSLLALRAVAPATFAAEKDAEPVDAFAEHKKLFAESRFPSASTCRTCHPGHYREWSVSPHAYAQMSPVFNSMHATIVKQTAGSNGDFCIRCHNQVGMNLGEPVFMKNEDRHPTSREGITCIVCHRVNNAYGKVSGRFSLVEGDLLEPVYGPTGNEELSRVLSLPDKYRVVTDRDQPGRKIHTEAKRFFQLSQSAFCGACHDVTLMNGFRLEEAFSEFKNSPAAKRGETCHDCHMGKKPGVNAG